MQASPRTTAEHDQISSECYSPPKSSSEIDTFEFLDLTGDKDTTDDARNTQPTEIGNTYLTK